VRGVSWLRAAGLLVWLALVMVPQAMASPVLQGIQSSGVIRIGIKSDFPPFGMLDSEGQPTGLEVDLARDVARRLNVKLALIKVSTENRLQRLEQGSVDLLIATTADTMERRRIATAIEPAYYAGGVTVMLRENLHITDWPGLRGKTLCATQGAYFNRPMTERYLLDLVIYRDTRDALLGLRDGRCIGYLYTQVAIQSFLAKEEWKGFIAPMTPALVTQWAMFVARTEKGSAFERIMGDIVADWHRNGFLIEREAAWKLPASGFLSNARQQWTTKDTSGAHVCRRNDDGLWAVECRNTALMTSEQASGLLNIGLLIKEKTGLDFSFVYDPFDRTRFLKALAVTIWMMLCCVVISLAWGMAWAMIADHPKRWIGKPAQWLAVHARMTPPLLQMYLIFFGVGGVLFANLGWSLYPMAVAIACMSHYTGAAIMNSLLEAAHHARLGEPSFRLLSAKNLMQATLLSRAPIMGSLINVMKQTVMASAIGVGELLMVAMAIMADQGNIGVMMNVLLLAYLGLITLATVVLSHLQARWARRLAEEGPRT
jgi:polar amino acid transport system substrate-binding protein